MIDRLCLMCDFYDEDFECTLPSFYEYACLLSKYEDDLKDNSISDDDFNIVQSGERK